MKLIFMGTPDFAVPCLEALIRAGHEVTAVFTQPDKPVGRKQTLTPPAVKVCALSHGLTVYQPATLLDGEAARLMASPEPDAIIVAAYGKILPKEILDLPRFGCINVHGSLLPKYRGAAPIQWAVINGESETGITIMRMNEGLDTGDILTARAVPIGIDDTAESMFDKLSELGAEMITDALDKLEKGELTAVPQDEAQATYAPMLSKEISLIDWSQPAYRVHDLIRGLYSWPVAHTILNGKKLKILSSALSDLEGEAGTIISTAPLTVACSSGSVIIKTLQLEGKKAMDSKDFLVGHKLSTGERLGDQICL